jgi:hypothetical protein
MTEDIERIPAFGDYTIQYPFYEPPPDRCTFSASIRYTSDDYWLIMRGENVFNEDGPGFSQWPAEAQVLCGHEEFCGSNFSAGDMYINERASNPDQTGSAKTWLQAGINHHIEKVVSQLRGMDITRHGRRQSSAYRRMISAIRR